MHGSAHRLSAIRIMAEKDYNKGERGKKKIHCKEFATRVCSSSLQIHIGYALGIVVPL